MVCVSFKILMRLHAGGMLESYQFSSTHYEFQKLQNKNGIFSPVKASRKCVSKVVRPTSPECKTCAIEEDGLQPLALMVFQDVFLIYLLGILMSFVSSVIENLLS